MSIVSSHHHCQPSFTHEQRCGIGTLSKVSYSGPCFSGRLAFSHSLCLKSSCKEQTGSRRRFSRICSVVDDGMNPDSSDDEEKESLDDKSKRV